MTSVELFNPEKHYEHVAKWWTEQNWPVMPLTHLPQTGIMVSYDGAPAACAWIYKTDSAICWLEWIVASPLIRHEERANVLSVLISSATMAARLMGFQSIFTSSKNQSLEARLKGHGFTPTDQGVTQHVCDISGRVK
jgi:hypothetical protein